MKLKSAIRNQQTAVSRRPPASERGIALVITLILLSVTLVMAVAFLAISRRERSSVTTETSTAMARLAADSGLANAEAQILATVLQTSNVYNFGLIVSTNYINADGFASGSANPTNVNYFYNTGNPVNAADFIQNVANLWFLPRVPVFVLDRNANTNDFRFYLDLNRNGRFDANGPVPVVGQSGGYVHTDGSAESGSLANVLTNFMLGDPEWIGVLERPDAPHGPNNKFLSRYAFIAMPAGNTLDLNFIYNQALIPHFGYSQKPMNPTTDGYLRNQGVGGWELNLAAFLADLNTNEWGQSIGAAGFYQYNQANLPSSSNAGRAFNDALALLAYRYNFDYGMLRTFSSVFPNYPVGGGAVDIFPFGSVMTAATMPFYNSSLLVQNNSWPGADNTNHYFALTSDLFDPTKVQNGVGAFIDRLQFASTNVSTYDRYTFYRLLAQLGTDSAPEAGKLNVNYVNVDNGGNIVPNMETNCIPWTNSIKFFTNAADRMLRAYTKQWFQADPSNYLATYYGITNVYYSYNDAYGTKHVYDPNGYGLTNIPFIGMTNQIPAFGVTNIPVLVNSNFVYQPAVQRVLQLAANIYDATTNNTAALGQDFPSVFRPLFFKKDNFGNIFVRGYTNMTPVINLVDPRLSQPFDASFLAATVPTGNLPLVDNIYGVPWIIGAKKGFPSFNEFSMDSVVNITRKMQVTRSDFTTSATITATNTAYIFGISNCIGVEYWNPYTNDYSGPLQAIVYDNLTMNLTNDAGFSQTSYFPLTQPFITVINPWPRSTWNNGGTLNTNAVNPFYVPMVTNVLYLTNSVYQWGGGFQTADTAGWQTTHTDVVMPHFGLRTTNWFQGYILAGNRVIDYVSFNGPNSVRDLNSEIETHQGKASYDDMWNDALNKRGSPWGIVNQMGVSQNLPTMNTTYWGTTGQDQNRAIAEIDGFTAFMGGTPTMPVPTGYENIYNSYLTNLTVQVPFTPTVTAFQYTSWQANDPFVHYLSSDLNFADLKGNPHTGTNVVYTPPTYTLPPLLPNIGMLNDRFLPWGKSQLFADSINNPYDTTLKDPLVNQSDSWQFPGTRLPSVGWLGRIHRGTPWQTVYLKATNLLALGEGTVNGTNTWMHWTGNNNTYDAVDSSPIQDRLLFDLFTTALNDNATRGQLPINVDASNTGNPAAGLAAWSAVFSGVVVPTNIAGINPVIINPAGPDLTTNSPLAAIVASINSIRQAFTNGPFPSRGGAFKHVGDILSVPALSQNSQYLKGLNLTNSIPDALMEWLPQQTLGLLRLSDQPRFVIYSYGQTLVPSLNGVVNSGSYAGMITNYQVTAETVTRAVVRIEGAPTNAHAVVESFNVLPPD